VLAGLTSETRTLEPYRYALRITSAVSGARAALATQRATDLAQAGCTHFLSYGLAGGLAADLPVGTVLLPKRVMDAVGRLYPVDAAWHGRMAALLKAMSPVTAPLVGTDEAISSLAGKRRLREDTGAVAVDMESHHLGQVAAARNRPFLVLRVVADTAEHVLPPAATVAITPEGATDIVAVLGALLRQPGQLPDLIRLGRAAARANAALLGCARLCGDGGFAVL
jgi:hopanoid-associated phosphorylase